MYGAKWKTKFQIEDQLDVEMPTSLIYNRDLNKDLDRTFPTVKFFKDHKYTLKNIILNFVEINSAMDYFQGLCYIVYSLFYAFQDTVSPEYYTFYATHKVVSPLRPIIPMDENDEGPRIFIDNISKLIILTIFQKKPELGKKLQELNIVNVFVVSGLPALFANWYNIDDVLLLWDFLFDNSTSKMLENIINYLTYFFIYHEKIILHLPFEHILQVLQQRQGLGKILLMLKYNKKIL